MNPGITILTPTIAPRAGMLARAQASVRTQTRPANDHLIVLDTTGAGAGATRNTGLAGVMTEWVAFLDDDDELLPHHLQACEQAAHETRADVIYPIGSYTQLGDDPLRQTGTPFNPDRLRAGNFIPITVLARTATVLDAGGFPTGDQVPRMGGQPCEDWGLWLRMLDIGASFAPLHEVTWICHQHDSNFSGHPWQPVQPLVNR